MRIGLSLLLVAAGAVLLLSCQTTEPRRNSPTNAPAAYLGFDRNIYPGDEAMKSLRRDFAFTGYWLSPPPGETTNTWTGQRQYLGSQGFGFLLLYRGPLSRQLKIAAAASKRGTSDAQNAVAAARREGFPDRAIIFVDLEEGGRLSDAFHAYLQAWAEEVARNAYHPGVYCSGIPVKEDPGTTIVTADDIRAHIGTQDLTYFICNDTCPPSPGCTFTANPPAPSVGGTAYAQIWQFVRSPREMEFSAHCPPGYASDGNCYAPGDAGHLWHLDVSTASSADPSNGR